MARLSIHIDGEEQKIYGKPEDVEKIREELQDAPDGTDWVRYIAESLVYRKQSKY